MNFPNETALFYDSGIFMSWAEKLTEMFGRVLLYVPWKQQFPVSTATRIGTGISNVERICGLNDESGRDFWDIVDEEEIDLFIFPDVGDADIQAHLRKLGKRVWGSSHADDLELFRADTKRLIEKINLPQQPWEEVIGIDNLRKVLYEKTECCWIKLSGTRGDSESFEYSPADPDSTEYELKRLETHLGRITKQMHFTVEAEIYPSCEIGYDGVCVDGEFPPESLVGIEAKDQAYFGAVCAYDDLPEQMRMVNNKLAPILREYQHRNCISTEIRIPEDLTPYLIDLTMRFPSPPSEVYQEIISNWDEVFWYGAEGIIVPFQFKHKYAAQVIIGCEQAEKDAQTIRFPKEIAPYVKLKNYHIVDGVHEVLPQPIPMREIGSVIATSNDPIEAIKLVQERAKMLEPGDLILRTDKLGKAIAEFEQGIDYGVKFNNLKLPTSEEIAALSV